MDVNPFTYFVKNGPFWQVSKYFCRSDDYISSLVRSHGLLNNWSPSRIHLLETEIQKWKIRIYIFEYFRKFKHIPHLMPNIVGHAECKDIIDFFPSLVKLYQNAADPLVGKMEIPSFGNTVAPPSVSDS